MSMLRPLQSRVGEHCSATTSGAVQMSVSWRTPQKATRHVPRDCKLHSLTTGRQLLGNRLVAKQLKKAQRTRQSSAHVQAAYGAVLGAQPVITFSLAKLAANILGWGVLAGSCIRSVPQIVKILKDKSAEGLSVSAQIMELITYNVTVAYNMRLGYHFITYGEVLTCWLQDAMIMFLILKFNDMMDWKAYTGTAMFLASLYVLAVIPMNMLAALQAGTILLKIGGRLPQIMMNWKRGDSGQLSGLMCGFNLAGNLARIVTTAVLTQDLINLVGTIIQAAMNAVLLLQTIVTPGKKEVRSQPPMEEDNRQLAIA